MSADEIRWLAGEQSGDMTATDVNCIDISEDIRAALLAYAAMVERCNELIANYSLDIEDCGQSCVEMGREAMINKRMCREFNYILKGGTK